MNLVARLLSRLERPHAAWAVIGLAMVLASPALFSPLVADDLIHQMRGQPDRALGGFEDPEVPLFVFATGESDQRAAAMEEGSFSWWTAEGMKFAFWRPIAAATHHLDTLLFDDHSVGIHAHSLLWFLLLLMALSRLYKRFHAPPLAVLALALYALDDARGMVLSFGANRNALIAAFFGVCALIAHDRWRRDGWRPGAVLGPAMLALGLLSGDIAVATTGFVFAHALFLDEGPLRTRLWALVPYALIVIGWQLLFSHLGYGLNGSGIYVHPLNEPLVFVTKLLERVPVLALGQLALPTSDLWLVYPGALKVIVYALALVVIAGVGRLLWPWLRRDATLRFWTLGGLLALIPVSATFASDRLLVFVGIGAAGALGCLFARSVQTPPGRWAARAIGALVVLHLVIAPLTLPVRAMSTAMMQSVLVKTDQTIPRDASVEGKTLVVVQALSDGLISYALVFRASQEVPRPRNVRLLSSGDRETRVTRVDAQTLHISPEGGFYATEIEQMLRAPHLPYAVGDTVTLSNMTVTITHIDETGRAMEADFRFSSPLERPEWLWTMWREGPLVPWTPPPIGETVTLPPVW